jgi:RNA polymerase sigma-70 factor (ECF subfamily)
MDNVTASLTLDGFGMDDSHSEDPSATPSAAPSASEQELIRRLRLGDSVAFEVLFRTYFRVLFGLIYDVVRSRAIAEEILQDLFSSLWERRAVLDVRGPLKSYLYRAARNRALSYARHERVRARWHAKSLREAPVSAAPPIADRVVVDQEFAAALARAVDRLSPRAREAYILRWRHELPYAEIAQIMGISVKGVERRISSALKTLRDALRDFAP